MTRDDLIRIDVAASILDRSERTLWRWHSAGEALGVPFHFEAQDTMTKRIYVRRDVVERINTLRLRRFSRRD